MRVHIFPPLSLESDFPPLACRCLVPSQHKSVLTNSRFCLKMLIFACRSPDLPDLLVINVQEMGGKHKENLALMLRQGCVYFFLWKRGSRNVCFVFFCDVFRGCRDILPQTFNLLSRRIRQLYKDAGSEVRTDVCFECLRLSMSV